MSRKEIITPLNSHLLAFWYLASSLFCFAVQYVLIIKIIKPISFAQASLALCLLGYLQCSLNSPVIHDSKENHRLILSHCFLPYGSGAWPWFFLWQSSQSVLASNYLDMCLLSSFRLEGRGCPLFLPSSPHSSNYTPCLLLNTFSSPLKTHMFFKHLSWINEYQRWGKE